MDIEFAWLALLTFAFVFAYLKLNRVEIEQKSLPGREEILLLRDRLTMVEAKLDQVSQSLHQLTELIIRERS